MCTRPNYMVWCPNKKIEWSFIPHQSYDKLIKNVSNGLVKADEFIEVPCGQCLECKLQYTRSWANRCILEAKNSPHNYFVTLTYDDKHLGDNSLNPKDLTDFVRSLRDYFRNHDINCKLRYFGCGEYGQQEGMRKHLHVILFDCPLDDLTDMFQMSVDGVLQNYYKPAQTHLDLRYSPLIHKCWDYKGNISVGLLTYDTAAYVAQYVTKKVNKDYQQFLKDTNKHPEFIRMSQGIGKVGFNLDDYVLDNMAVNGKITKLPRYFDKLLEKRHPEILEVVRKARLVKKAVNISSYVHSNRIKDKDNAVKELRLQQQVKLREKL